jgi:hypothetical protein
VARDASDGDTRLLVTDFVGDAFGYDKSGELTNEYQVKGEFADFGVRLDEQLVAVIEVKRCTTKLSPKHLRQVTSTRSMRGGVDQVTLPAGRPARCRRRRRPIRIRRGTTHRRTR